MALDAIRFEQLSDEALQICGFSYLDTRGWFCDGFKCPFVVGHVVVYRDTGHITRAYARQVAAPLRNAFRRCLFSNCPA